MFQIQSTLHSYEGILVKPFVTGTGKSLNLCVAQLCQEYIYFFLLCKKFLGEYMARLHWVIKKFRKKSTNYFKCSEK